MSLTLVNRTYPGPEHDPRVRRGYTSMTFDSSYPTGGEALAATSLDANLVEIRGLNVVGSNTAAALYQLQYDKEAGKVVAMTAGAQVANTTNLSALTFYVEWSGIGN